MPRSSPSKPRLSTGEAEPATLTVAEASERLGLSPRAVRRAIRAGQIEAIQIGRRWLVLREPLDAQLRGRRPERGDLGKLLGGGPPAET